MVDQPRLLEVVRTAGAASLAGVLDAVVPRAFVGAETKQASDGGSNPRFAGRSSTTATPTEPTAAPVRSCAIVSDRPRLAAALAGRARCPRPSPAAASSWPTASTARPRALQRRWSRSAGPLDAVVVALEGHPRHLERARGLGARAGRPPRACSRHLHDDASWSRAVADYAGRGRPPRPPRGPDRRHHPGRSQPGPGLGPAGPRGRGRRRRTGSPPSPPVSRPRGRPPARPPASWSPTSSAHPEAAPLWPARSWWSSDRLARAAQPPPPDRHA